MNRIVYFGFRVLAFTLIHLNVSGQMVIDTDQNTIQKRFTPPKGFRRVASNSDSFGNYLRNLPLKPDGAEVTLYNGETKFNQEAHAAVVDLPIGKYDLHQCADAIIRLRADYFRTHGLIDQIKFHFTNGFLVEYEEWLQGKKMVIEGNKTYWKDGLAARANSDENYFSQLSL